MSVYSWTSVSLAQLDYDVAVIGPELTALCDAVRTHPECRKKRQAVRVKKLNLRVKPCIGDGSCLFRGLSYILYGTDTYHAHIRQQSVMYVSQDLELFLATGRADIATYLAEMLIPIPGTPTNWPEQPEIVAACTVFQINLRIISDAETNWYLTHSSGFPIEHGVLLYDTEAGYEHYSVIVRGQLDEPPPSLPPENPQTAKKPGAKKKPPSETSDSSEGSDESSITCAPLGIRRVHLHTCSVGGFLKTLPLNGEPQKDPLVVTAWDREIFYKDDHCCNADAYLTEGLPSVRNMRQSTTRRSWNALIEVTVDRNGGVITRTKCNKSKRDCGTPVPETD